MTIQKRIIIIIFILFLLLPFSITRPFLRAFTVLQTAIGNREFRLVRFIQRNELKITYWVWGFILLGLPIVLTE